MHVLVAIVAFRNTADVVKCLMALSKSTHVDFEVTICENGGREAFVKVTANCPATLSGGQHVQYIEAPGNLGYAGGVNVCVGAAAKAYDAVWVLNPDTEPAPEALAALVAGLTSCDAVGGRLLMSDGRLQNWGDRKSVV